MSTITEQERNKLLAYAYPADEPDARPAKGSGAEYALANPSTVPQNPLDDYAAILQYAAPADPQQELDLKYAWIAAENEKNGRLAAQAEIDKREKGRRMMAVGQDGPDAEWPGAITYEPRDMPEYATNLSLSDKTAIWDAYLNKYTGRAIPDYEQGLDAGSRPYYDEGNSWTNLSVAATSTLGRMGAGLQGIVDPEGALETQAAQQRILPYGRDTATSFVGEAGANVLPTAIGAVLGGPAGGYVAMAGLSGSTFGDTRAQIEQLRRQGQQISVGEELTIAALSAAAEIGGEKIGLDAILKRSLVNPSSPLFKRVVQRTMEYAATAGVNMGEEMATQVVQNALMQRVDPNQMLAEGVGEAGLQGGAGGIMARGLNEIANIGQGSTDPNAFTRQRQLRVGPFADPTFRGGSPMLDQATVAPGITGTIEDANVQADPALLNRLAQPAADEPGIFPAAPQQQAAPVQMPEGQFSDVTDFDPAMLDRLLNPTPVREDDTSTAAADQRVQGPQAATERARTRQDDAAEVERIRRMMFEDRPAETPPGAPEQAAETPKALPGRKYAQSDPVYQRQKQALREHSYGEGMVIHGTTAQELPAILSGGLKPSGLSARVDAEKVGAGGKSVGTAVSYAGKGGVGDPVMLVLKPGVTVEDSDGGAGAVAVSSQGTDGVRPQDIAGVVFGDGTRIRWGDKAAIQAKLDELAQPPKRSLEGGATKPEAPAKATPLKNRPPAREDATGDEALRQEYADIMDRLPDDWLNTPPEQHTEQTQNDLLRLAEIAATMRTAGQTPPKRVKKASKLAESIDAERERRAAEPPAPPRQSGTLIQQADYPRPDPEIKLAAGARVVFDAGNSTTGYLATITRKGDPANFWIKQDGVDREFEVHRSRLYAIEAAPLGKLVVKTIRTGEETVIPDKPASAAPLTAEEVGVEWKTARIIPTRGGIIAVPTEQPKTPDADTSYGAKNKVVTREQYAEIKKKLKDRLNRMNSIGFDPELMVLTAQAAAFHVESGVRKFVDYARAMVADLGPAVSPYLQSAYLAARRMPGMESARGEMDTAEYVDGLSQTQVDGMIADVEQGEADGESQQQAEHVAPNPAASAAGITADAAAGQSAGLAEPAADTAAGEPAAAEEGVRAPALGERQLPARAAGGAEGSDQPGGEPVLRGDTPMDGGERPARPAGDAGAAGAPAVSPAVAEQPGTGAGESVQRRVSKRAARSDRGARDGGAVPAGGQGRDAASGVQAEEAGGTSVGVPAGGNAKRRKDVSPADLNHVIAPGDTIAPRGDVTKFNANVAAIKLLKQLEAEDRNPTPDEKKTLAQYTGWGGLSQAFGSTNDLKWLDRREEVVKLLTREEYDAARQSTLYAHYTSAEVIRDGIWKIVERLGVKGGRFLENSAGVGHMIGLMPQSLDASWSAVEIDSISGRILKKLYPQANVQNVGFEEARFPANTFDLVVGNFPFNATGPIDKRYPKFSLHNYFFARSVDLLKPGGFIVAITSDSTMDNGASAAFRAWMADRADLVGAVRLPNTAFKANAGTEVTTDIIVFRKKDGQPFALAQRFLGTTPIPVVEKDKAPIYVNEYFAANPKQMAGLPSRSGTMYREDSPALLPFKDKSIEQAMADAINGLPSDLATFSATEEAAVWHEQAVAPSEAKEYSYQPITFGDKTTVRQVLDGQLVEPEWMKAPNLRRTRQATAAVWFPVRDAALSLIRAEQNDAPSADIEQMRKTLRQKYDAAVAERGPINSRNYAHLQDDPDFGVTAALEQAVSEDKTVEKNGIKLKLRVKTWKPGAILERRVNFPLVRPTKAESLSDAVNISISWDARLNVPYMAQLLGKTPDEVTRDLLNDDQAFVDPKTGILEVPASYLSGNVRQKLRDAIEAADADPALYERNVEALKKVQPTRLTMSQIKVRLGATWVPPTVLNDWLAALFDVTPARTAGSIDRIDVISDWAFRWPWEITNSIKNRNELAGGGMQANKIIEATLGLKTVSVFDEFEEDGKTKRVINQQKTEAARLAQDKIKGHFEKWVKSSQHTAMLEDLYNERYNAHVEKQFPAATFPYYPGASQVKQLRVNQRNAVARFVTESGYMAHGVGAGKTLSQITIAMEWRRLGLARKPLIVVQNATLPQFVAAFKEQYPGAAVLAPSRKEFDASNRRKMLGRIATSEVDAIILPHSQFERIANNPDRERMYLQAMLDKIEDVLVERRKGAGRSDPTVKQLENAKRKMENRVGELLELAKDDTLTFEELGIDGLLVDEAHKYKKLQFTTKSENVKGLDKSASKGALDTFLKASYIREKTGGRNVVFASGTPVSNTLAEIWNAIRFVRPDVLEGFSVPNFDDFLTNYTEITTSTERNDVGQLKPVTRLASFQNLPELISMWRTAADVVNTEDIPGIERPVIKGGRPELVQVERTPTVDSFMSYLLERYKAFNKMSGKEKRENSSEPLVINGLARKAALDMRLIDPKAADEPGSKLNVAARRVYDIWKQTADQKGTQVIFAEIYQSSEETADGKKIPDSSRFNAFTDMRDKLIGMGVPPEQIAIINDYENDAKREALFEAMNEGTIRVLMGTTEKMGVGVNVQEKLYALHHLTPAWRPSDMEQREGRIIRDGNTFTEVEIIRYGVVNTLDEGMFRRLAMKQKFINQVMRGDRNKRESEDIGEEVALNYAEAAAAFSGDPMLVEAFETETLVKRLEAAEQGHLLEQDDARRSQRTNEANARSARKNAALYREIHAELAPVLTAQREDDAAREAVEQRLQKSIDGGLAALASKVKQEGRSLAAFRQEIVTFRESGVSVAMVAVQPTNRDGLPEGDPYVAYTPFLRGDSVQSADAVRLSNGQAKTGAGMWRATVDRVLDLADTAAMLDKQAGTAERNAQQLAALADRPFDEAARLATAREKLARLMGILEEKAKADAAKDDTTIPTVQQVLNDAKQLGLSSAETWDTLLPKTAEALRKEFGGGAPAAFWNFFVDGMGIDKINADQQVALYDAKVHPDERDGPALLALRQPEGPWLDRVKVMIREALNKSAEFVRNPDVQKGVAVALLMAGMSQFADPALGAMAAAPFVLPKGVRAKLKAAGVWLMGGKTGPDSDFTFGQDTIEQRYQEARKGIQTPPLLVRLKEQAEALWKMSNEPVGLAINARWAEANAALILLKKQKGMQADVAVRLMDQITAPLDNAQYDIFTRKTILDDLNEEIDRQMADGRTEEEVRLPFAFKPTDVREELARLNERVDADEAVKFALDQRRTAWKAIKNPYVREMGRLGFDAAKKLKRENYFRHQVLQYASFTAPKGVGGKVELPTQRGFLRRRQGSELDINASYLQAEFEVMSQMLYDTKIAETLNRVGKHYDVLKQLKREAVKQNEAGVYSLFEEVAKSQGATTNEEVAEAAKKLFNITLNRKMAIGFGKLMQLAADGELPDSPDKKWAGLLDAMSESARAGTKLTDEHMGRLFRYMKWVMDDSANPDEARLAVATILKGKSEKKKIMQTMLGADYQTWEDLIPDGYVQWQPREGSHFYLADTIPHRVAQELLTGVLQEANIKPHQIKQVLAKGAPFTPFVIPQELADTLDRVLEGSAQTPIARAGRQLLGRWKQFVLMMPYRAFKYNLRNFAGDLDAQIALNPSGIKKMPQAFRDVLALYRTKAEAPMLKEFRERGGSAATLAVTELQNVDELEFFRKFEQAGTWKGAPARALKWWFGKAQTVSDFRETVFRYAQFLDYAEKIKATGKPHNYGASIPEEVDALKDPLDRAFLLANEVQGAYDRVSETGQHLREYWIPFWSFTESNFRRYTRGFKNAVRDDGLTIAIGKGLLKQAASPMVYYRVGSFMLKASAVWAALQVWNFLFWGDEEDDLPPEVKARPHIILGKNPINGKTIYFDRLGSVTDMLEWFGLDTPQKDLLDFLNGKRTGGEIVRDMGLSPANKLLNSLNPFFIAFAEGISGTQFYPKPADAIVGLGRRRQIRDYGRWMSDKLFLGAEYDTIANVPTQAAVDRVTGIFAYQTDPDQAAYWAILDEKDRYLRKIGKGRGSGGGGTDNPRTDALRYYRKALHLKDAEDAAYWLDQYAQLGGTRQSLKTSLRNLDPLAGLKQEEQREFWKFLAEEDRRRLGKAQRYYQTVLLGGGRAPDEE